LYKKGDLVSSILFHKYHNHSRSTSRYPGIPISIYPLAALNLFNFPPAHLRPSLTLRKNNPPAGKVMRWEPGRIFRGTPSLYHWMVGVGLPSALQLSVAGSCRGTVVSMGCSTIRGGWDPEKRGDRGGYERNVEYICMYQMGKAPFRFRCVSQRRRHHRQRFVQMRKETKRKN